jgi:hypothetical protein
MCVLYKIDNDNKLTEEKLSPNNNMSIHSLSSYLIEYFLPCQLTASF